MACQYIHIVLISILTLVMPGTAFAGLIDSNHPADPYSTPNSTPFTTSPYTIAHAGLYAISNTEPSRIENTKIDKEIALMTTIPFQLVNGLIVISVDVDNVTGSYVFDTGADAVLLNNKESLNIKNNKGLVSAKGNIASEAYQIENLVIGAYAQQDVPALMTDLSAVENFLDIKLDGIIGPNFLEDLFVSIDYSDEIMGFYNSTDFRKYNPSISDTYADQGYTQSKISLTQGIPLITLEHNNKSYLFALDSGATTHFVDPTQLNNINLNRSSKTSDIITADGTQHIQEQYIINQCTINNTALKSSSFTTLDLSHINEQLEDNIAGLLSISKLTQDEMIIDFGAGHVYFR